MRYGPVSTECYTWVGSISIKLCPKQFSRRYLLLLVVFSSSCFGLAWCSLWFGYLLFVAIVPMLLIVKHLTVVKRKSLLSCLFYIFLTLFLWNNLTIWWLCKAAFAALLFTACYNTLCLSLPWFFFYYMRKWGGVYAGYVGLITCWLTLEYAHLTWEWWELTFPWLNLGNGLAAMSGWIQWYEYTGILGGSLWILGVNILLYHLLFEKISRLLLKGFFCWLLLPILTSLMMYYNHIEKGAGVEAVVVQPNFDSYTEKDVTSPFFVPYATQMDRLLNLSKERLTVATSLVIWPESAINAWLEERFVHDYALIQPIGKFLEQHTAVSLITGVSSLCAYGATKVTQTAKIRRGQYVDYFNSVFHFKAGQKIAIYHKEKRLPGGEYIPYIHLFSDRILSWIKQKIADIGDIDPCFGKGDGSKVFEIDHEIKVAPINCYESLYGAFVGSASQKGATLFAVVTNDGWWGNTPIYHHHFQYSRLLAIAHRRSVMRSANTGISGFINQRGDVIAATNRLEPAAIRQVVYANKKITFYSLYGDYIGRFSSWACWIVLFMVLMIRLQRNKSGSFE